MGRCATHEAQSETAANRRKRSVLTRLRPIFPHQTPGPSFDRITRNCEGTPERDDGSSGVNSAPADQLPTGEPPTQTASGGARTHNLWLRRPTLYPVELRMRQVWTIGSVRNAVKRNCSTKARTSDLHRRTRRSQRFRRLPH